METDYPLVVLDICIYKYSNKYNNNILKDIVEYGLF